MKDLEHYLELALNEEMAEQAVSIELYMVGDKLKMDVVNGELSDTGRKTLGEFLKTIKKDDFAANDKKQLDILMNGEQTKVLRSNKDPQGPSSTPEGDSKQKAIGMATRGMKKVKGGLVS